MNIIVKKFGGNTLSSVDNLKQVSLIIKNSLSTFERIIVVVSARGQSTDQLDQNISKIMNVNTYEKRREYDKYLSIGEQESSSMLALMLLNENIQAISLLGWQLPIITDDNYTNAVVQRIPVQNINKYLSTHQVLIIAGFQGIYEHHITTLGRGGSDITAVSLAASLGSTCYIYSDVKGIYNVDPNIIESAQIKERITYKEIMPMISSGLSVLNYRAFDIAYKHDLTIKFLSINCKQESTILSKESQVMNTQITTSTIKEPLMLIKVDKHGNEFIRKINDMKIRILFLLEQMSEVTMIVDTAIMKYENLEYSILKENLGMVTIFTSCISDSCQLSAEIKNLLHMHNIPIVFNFIQGDRLIFALDTIQIKPAIKHIYNSITIQQEISQ